MHLENSEPLFFSYDVLPKGYEINPDWVNRQVTRTGFLGLIEEGILKRKTHKNPEQFEEKIEEFISFVKIAIEEIFEDMWSWHEKIEKLVGEEEFENNLDYCSFGHQIEAGRLEFERVFDRNWKRYIRSERNQRLRFGNPLQI